MAEPVPVPVPLEVPLETSHDEPPKPKFDVNDMFPLLLISSTVHTKFRGQRLAEDIHSMKSPFLNFGDDLHDVSVRERITCSEDAASVGGACVPGPSLVTHSQ